MDQLKRALPSKLFDILERAGISTPKQILFLSFWDIKKLTNLPSADIIFVKDAVADLLAPVSVTCDELPRGKHELRVKTGCVDIDNLLKGGFRRGTLTEIYGESGSGKTQIALQAAAHNADSGCVFICTEDQFPVNRFEQIKQDQHSKSNQDYGKNVFVEHITEATDVLSCVRVRLPKLVEKNRTCLIIIDSIAAPFRSEYSNYIQRAEDMRELGISLMRLAQDFNLAVICINQVTASFNGTDDVIPSLGLAWSNMVSTRLLLKKTTETVQISNLLAKNCIDTSTLTVRKFSVAFAPDLPSSSVKLIITPSGVQTLD